MFNGQPVGIHTSVTVLWDTLEWDDVGAWRKDNPGVITTPPGYNAARVSVHSSWLAQFNSAGKTARIVQTRNSPTTPTTFFLVEYGYPENTNYSSLGQYMAPGTWWPTSPGNIIYFQVNNGNPFASTFSPANVGPGPAWLQVEWAYTYSQTDTQFH